MLPAQQPQALMNMQLVSDTSSSIELVHSSQKITNALESWVCLQAKLAKVPVARAKRQKRDGALTWEVPPPLEQASQSVQQDHSVTLQQRLQPWVEAFFPWQVVEGFLRS